MSAAQFSDYCPLCHHAAVILNVSRDHHAVCHDCRAYWHVGSNLFSAWRNEEPADWELNKKILAIYKNVSADYERLAQYTQYLDSLPLKEAANALTLNEYSAGKSERTAPAKLKTSRPALGSLGDCLAETAAHQPHGFTKITGCTESFWRDIPANRPDANRPDAPWFVLEAATACLEPAPVHIFITAGTPAATACEILKHAARWLKEHGDELPGYTPLEPVATDDDSDTIPF